MIERLHADFDSDIPASASLAIALSISKVTPSDSPAARAVAVGGILDSGSVLSEFPAVSVSSGSILSEFPRTWGKRIHATKRPQPRGTQIFNKTRYLVTVL